ncbi:MAG TPA: hypothetical protein DCL21_07105 [Alphaproteobacteria bacterium]|nr:hypothetical protein [Alphaproteobacteria bacterium]
MKYIVSINTPKEAWKFVMGMYFSYHNHLKKFGYSYKQFIPTLQSIDDFFKDESHFQKKKKNEFYEADIADIKEDFFNYYSLEHFEESITFFNENVIPKIDKVLPKLQKMQDNWGMYIPEEFNTWFTYGNGGSYSGDKNNPGVILRSTSLNLNNMAFVSIHELVHVCIQEDIIRKYDIPQDIKEQIVDVICVDYLKTQKHKQSFNTPGFSDFITAETVVEDLPSAVKQLKEYLSSEKKF